MNGVFDSHRYFGCGINLADGVTILGIEVRLDWTANSPAINPGMDVELSSDGGSNWTEVKSVSRGNTNERTDILGGPGDT